MSHQDARKVFWGNHRQNKRVWCLKNCFLKPFKNKTSDFECHCIQESWTFAINDKKKQKREIFYWCNCTVLSITWNIARSNHYTAEVTCYVQCCCKTFEKITWNGKRWEWHMLWNVIWYILCKYKITYTRERCNTAQSTQSLPRIYGHSN